MYDLLAQQVVQAGTPPAVPHKGDPALSPAYRRLEEAGRQLLEVIARNKGGSNKDLGKFADQIRALMDKWER